MMMVLKDMSLAPFTFSRRAAHTRPAALQIWHIVSHVTAAV